MATFNNKIVIFNSLYKKKIKCSKYMLSEGLLYTDVN